MRRAERVSEADSASIRLAESTAAALDAPLRVGAGPSALAALAPAHGAALAALREDTMSTPDGLDAFLATVTRPTPGSVDGGARFDLGT